MINSPQKKNLKSDEEAKNQFIKQLCKEGYSNIKVTLSPADITAHLNGLVYYFEIKFTNQTDKYFGASTLTEWAASIANSGRYWFVIAYKQNDNWNFTRYTPEEFMQYSYVPPFKVFFNIPIGNIKVETPKRKSKSVRLTKRRIEMMMKFYENLKNCS